MKQILLFLFFLPLLNSCAAQDDYVTARSRMVRDQIRGRGISDSRVIRAMNKVERHRFVPARAKNLAYIDSPLAIGEGQTISQPFIVAFMTEQLYLRPGMKVLEIGTGSGYQAAILAEIVDEVYTIEINAKLGKRAAETLSGLGYDNVFVKIGDGYQGWDEHAPFDAIIVTCSPNEIPGPLKDQLAEGGRMIIPVGGKYIQSLVLNRKKNGKVKQHSILPVRFVPMIDRRGNRY